MIRAVLYDHDGTLVDSLAIVVAATNHVLATRGVPQRPAAEVIAAMVHPTGPRMGLHAGVDEPELQASLARDFYDAARLVGNDLAKPYRGIPEAVAAFAARGLRQGVVSNNEGALIRQLMAHLGLAHHFGAILGEEDFAVPKPDPSGLLEAARRLGVAPAECLYVGDTPSDLRAATAAGMCCIGVTWGIKPRSELAPHPFVALVDDADGLLDAVAASARG